MGPVEGEEEGCQVIVWVCFAYRYSDERENRKEKDRVGECACENHHVCHGKGRRK